MTVARSRAILLARRLRNSPTKRCFWNLVGIRVHRADWIGRMKHDLRLDRTARASVTNRPHLSGKDVRNSRRSCESR